MELNTIEWPPIQPFPSDAALLDLPRGIRWEIYYDGYSSPEKKTKAERWIEQYTGYYIRIDSQNQVITIAKVITREEIIEHLDFFKECERKYRELAAMLLQLKNDYCGALNSGNFLEWNYHSKGNYLFFDNTKTGEQITFPIKDEKVCQALEPFYFGQFIENNLEIRKLLPIAIYSQAGDWKFIAEVLSE